MKVNENARAKLMQRLKRAKKLGNRASNSRVALKKGGGVRTVSSKELMTRRRSGRKTARRFKHKLAAGRRRNMNKNIGLKRVMSRRRAGRNESVTLLSQLVESNLITSGCVMESLAENTLPRLTGMDHGSKSITSPFSVKYVESIVSSYVNSEDMNEAIDSLSVDPDVVNTFGGNLMLDIVEMHEGTDFGAITDIVPVSEGIIIFVNDTNEDKLVESLEPLAKYGTLTPIQESDEITVCEVAINEPAYLFQPGISLENEKSVLESYDEGIKNLVVEADEDYSGPNFDELDDMDDLSELEADVE